MPNITRGASMYGLIRYLAGNGKHNEHIEAHLVAGDPAVMAWHDDAQLDGAAALAISKDLDRPRLAFGTTITLPVRSNDGSLARSQHTGKALRRDAHVWHCSLSLRADEPPLSEEHWAAISEEFVAHMGFAQPSSQDAPCPWVAIRHGPSTGGNDHVHIAVSLVRENGAAASTWNDRPSAQRIAGELERKHGLQVLHSREAGLSARGVKPGEREVAARRQQPEVAREQLARTLRGCATAASDEAEFVRRARGGGVLMRPRYAAGRGDVVVGYSAAQRPAPSTGMADGSQSSRAAPVWYGGGHLARDLTLTRLRASWPDSPDHASAAISEWQAAKCNQRVAAPGRELITPSPQMWARYTAEVSALRERLRGVASDDRALWAHVAGETAGAFAAWSTRVESQPGPLAATADILARSAQLHAHQVRPRAAGLPSASGAALLLASAAAGGKGAVAESVLLRQLVNTSRAIYDAHRARGDARHAQQIYQVVTDRLQAVADRLPAVADAPSRLAVTDPQAGETRRIAQQGQLPPRAPGSPVPAPLPEPVKPATPSVAPNREIQR